MNMEPMFYLLHKCAYLLAIVPCAELDTPQLGTATILGSEPGTRADPTGARVLPVVRDVLRAELYASKGGPIQFDLLEPAQQRLGLQRA